MKIINAPFMSDERLGTLFSVLAPHGGCFVVGGAVRDSAMGMAPKDVDLATPVHPQDVIRALTDAGMRALPTGIEYGVVTAVIDGEPYEVTTFRRDVMCDGRRAVTAWGASLEEDAQRRDLTINALYVSRDGKIIDPTGGLCDLQERRIRFVGDAEVRIREDRLRALRMYRFWSRFGDPDPAAHEEALRAAAMFANDIGAVSRERVGSELIGLLSTDDPRPQIREMSRTGIWANVTSGADPGAVTEIIGAEKERGSGPVLVARLSALTEGAMRDGLRLPKKFVETVKAAITSAIEPDPAVTAWRYGPEVAEASVIIRTSRGDSAPSPDETKERVIHGVSAVFPVKGGDLPHLSGAELGAALRESRETWLRAGLTGDRDDVMRSAGLCEDHDPSM